MGGLGGDHLPRGLLTITAEKLANLPPKIRRDRRRAAHQLRRRAPLWRGWDLGGIWVGSGRDLVGIWVRSGWNLVVESQWDLG